MGFSLIPREMKFFDMFDEFVTILTGAAEKFHDMMTAFDNLDGRGKEMKREEVACDACVAQVITALDRTFITPFDREDIHTLATRLDDIIDNMEKTTFRLIAFRIDKPTPEAVEFARITKECCVRVAQAVRLLRDLGNSEKIHVLLREIGQLENDADRVYRNADASLFANLLTDGQTQITPVDILTLVKWRELYEWLEATVDACKHVANVISEIVIKGT